MVIMEKDSTNTVDWSKYATQYDNMVRYNTAYQRLLTTLFGLFNSQNLKKGSWVGDIGGGTGQFSIEFARQNRDLNVVLLDYNENSIRIAEKKSKELGLKNISFEHGDAELFTGYKLDAANMMHTLYVTRSKEDTEKPLRILQNLHAHLNEDGYFVLTDIEKRLSMIPWSIYVLWNVFQKEGLNTINIFKENVEVKKANQVIERKQLEGDYIIQSLDDCINLVKRAGFSKILAYNNDHYAPGIFGSPIDYQIIARK
jgi:ubiquinone/menaquinone biosynthesis C-methylase UbiE